MKKAKAKKVAVKKIKKADLKKIKGGVKVGKDTTRQKTVLTHEF
jgi:hypothetical protein